MTKHQFTHSFNGQDSWIFEMDPLVGPKGLRYRVRFEKGSQWTDCLLRSAIAGSSVEDLQRAVIEWESRILAPGSAKAPAA